jgi:tRNA threonylcarbamoyladenosine biosynthesis protein TsaE
MARDITLERHLHDASATRALGRALASVMTPGTVVLLDGPLGAGKTTLVQGLTAALGASPAASPSFVVAHHYEDGRMPIWHLDLYRMESDTEIEDLDLPQYMPDDGVAIVEWAARAPDAWPRDRIEVELAIDGVGRHAVVRGCGRCTAAIQTLCTAAGPV